MENISYSYKNMSPRTCPHCKYQYSLKEYFKGPFFKFANAEWACRNCKREISFSMWRRVILAVAMGILFSIVATFINNMEMNTALWIVTGIFLVCGWLFIFSFDKFRSAE